MNKMIISFIAVSMLLPLSSLAGGHDSSNGHSSFSDNVVKEQRAMLSKYIFATKVSFITFTRHWYGTENIYFYT